MTKSAIRNAIWRSRATAITGLILMFLIVFPGLPAALKATLYFVFGFLAFAFGLAGSRHKSYMDMPEAVTPPLVKNDSFNSQSEDNFPVRAEEKIEESKISQPEQAL